MLISNLMLAIRTHADQLASAYASEIRSNPRTHHFAGARVEELATAASALFVKLGDWLGERDTAGLEADFKARALRQRDSGIPLTEIVFAVIILKRHAWDFVKRNAVVDSIGDLYQRDEAIVLIAEFFDRLILAAVQGYEEGEKRWDHPRHVL